MVKQLDRLKAQVPPGGAVGSTGALADRVAELHKKTGLLANTTGSMFKVLEGKSRSLCYNRTENRGRGLAEILRNVLS